MSTVFPPDDDLVAYYDTGVETDRLARGEGALEFERTKELILRYLPAVTVVADVGGGVGRYAEWLADQGHIVELVEPVPSHVALAQARAGDPPSFGVRLGDARELPFRDVSFDAVLLLGPLYHLGDAADRAAAVAEAARVCRPGGVIFAAAICRTTPLLDAVRGGWLGHDELFANVRDETLGGRRVAEERRTSIFPDAYFHRPDELEAELAGAGLEVYGVFGVEGPGWLADDVDAAWDERSEERRVGK